MPSWSVAPVSRDGLIPVVLRIDSNDQISIRRVRGGDICPTGIDLFKDLSVDCSLSLEDVDQDVINIVCKVGLVPREFELLEEFFCSLRASPEGA